MVAKRAVKFLQLSDLHLDSPFSYLPAPKAQLRQAELREVFSRAMDLAVSEAVALILIPGDLFEYENVRSDTISFLARKLKQVAPIPCFIAPGNHDYYGPKSWYAQGGRDRLELGEPEWPDNVLIFSSENFVTIDDSEWFTVTGHAHLGFEMPAVSLAGVDPPSDERIHFLMIHGSRLGYVSPDKSVTFPFSDEDLLRRGFHYAALGHYHDFSTIPTIKDEELGKRSVRGAYSGCPVGRNFGERGPKSIMIGDATRDGAILQLHELATRRCVAITIDCTGIGTSTEFFELAREKIRASC